MPRIKRRKSLTCIYHIMLRGNEKKDIFLDNYDRIKLLEVLFDRIKEKNISVLAYCLMSNHVHFLIKENNKPISLTMKSIGTSYAGYFNKKYQRVGHLFQDRFRSQPIENESYLLSCVRYIHKNPVSAGIVSAETDYKWSSFDYYLNPKENNNIDIEFILNFFSADRQKAIERFKKYSLEDENEKFIDIIVDKEEKVFELNNLDDTKAFVANYLRRNGINMDCLKTRNCADLRNNLICNLRAKSFLSDRDIAKLLGLNRGMIERIKIK